MITTAGWSAWGSLPSSPLPPWPGDNLQLGGRDVFVRSAGDPAGADAVFVHGLGGASTNWTDLMALLGAQLHGRALDLPGFGRSDPPRNGRFPLDTHVGAVVDLIETLGGRPVHLFGNSLGGAAATRLAARRPDLVRTLTLISPALPDLRPRAGMDWRLPLIFLPGIGPRVQAKLASTPAHVRARAILGLVYADPTRVAPERLAEAAEEIVRRDGLGYSDAALVKSLRGLVAAQGRRGAGGLWAEAARVRAPTLLIWGRQDKLVDVRVGKRAVRTFPDSTLVVFDDAGHVAQLEAPHAVADAWRQRFSS